MGFRRTAASFLKNYKLSVPIVGAALALLAWLAFGFFAVHLLFVDDKVSEALPESIVAAQSKSKSDSGAEPVSGAEPEAASEPVAESDLKSVTQASGSFESDAHPTSGTALVLDDGDSSRFLRFENFKTDNGPDLNVYLVNSRAGGVDDRLDLGDLKGNIGDQNYELPPGADVTKYDTVVIWCVRFSVAFGRASLTSA